MAEIPRLEDFLAAPDEQVAAVAPESVIVVVGGTRRAAALAGQPTEGEAYVRWSVERMLMYHDMLFRHGIRHIVTPAVISSNLVEFARFRGRFLSLVAEHMAGSVSLAEYARRGWRVRLIGADQLPELHEATARLVMNTPAHWTRTVWWTVTIDSDASWMLLLAAAQQAGARTRAEAIRALYGEDIPPAQLLLSFGKPIISPELLPPLLIGELQGYWVQQPGYSLDEPMLRRILYDYAYTRVTGSGRERGGRYADVGQQRAAWEANAVLGEGLRLGGFWYPAPFPEVVTNIAS
jgi:hypothetical protein